MAAQPPASTANDKVPSEDVIARKTDLCISNAIVKTGLGFGTGVVLSFLLFRRRAFPVWIGTGFGMGSAYTDCERSFNPYSAPGLRVVSPPSSSSSSSSSSSTSAASTSAPRSTLELLSQRAGEAVGVAKEKVAEETKDVRKEAKQYGEQAKEKGLEAKENVQAKLRQV
ncbi:unnamed protein product [Jaminaea pallidilutea]